MSKMRKTFEQVTPGSRRFIYMESLNEYIHSKPRTARPDINKQQELELETFNEQWFYWQIAWQGGKDDKDET